MHSLATHRPVRATCPQPTMARTRGSHRQFVHPTKPGVVTIAGRLGADLPVGTERSILKQAGL